MSTREAQYAPMLALPKASFGLMANYAWTDDPRRLTFTFARYKFVSKMLSGRANVLEIGCADAFASKIVRQEVDSLTVSDFDPVFVADARANVDPKWPVRVLQHDILSGPVPGSYDGIYALDVMEHIDPYDEGAFLAHIVASLAPGGAVVLGMPSKESQAYASALSKAGHVNCKSGAELKATLDRYFRNVFLFSMNDEVVHTGFAPMAHYLLAVCTEAKCA
jgi:2-polyprenyl-3-methyl-5-hydroxy-6-metoxy-1,4-benzoquinol methylase